MRASIIAGLCTFALIGCSKRDSAPRHEPGSLPADASTTSPPTPNEPAAPEDRMEVFAERCRLGDRDSCTARGLALVAGTEVEKNVARGIELLQRACDQQSGDGCYHLAVAYLSGVVTGQQDAERGAKLLASACDLDQADACAELADLYEAGLAVEKNALEAMSLRAKALELRRSQLQD